MITAMPLVRMLLTDNFIINLRSAANKQAYAHACISMGIGPAFAVGAQIFKYVLRQVSFGAKSYLLPAGRYQKLQRQQQIPGGRAVVDTAGEQ